MLHIKHKPVHPHTHAPKHTHTFITCTQNLNLFFFFLNPSFMPLHTCDAHRPSWEKLIRLVLGTDK